MTEDPGLVDAEGLAVNWLVSSADLAEVVGDRVSTELPASFAAEARVQLFRVGGVPADDGPQHLDRPNLQVNAFGPTKAQAWAVAALVVRRMLAAPRGVHDQGVVTKAHRVVGPTWSPDPETDIPRYVLGFVLHVHPHRGA